MEKGAEDKEEVLPPPLPTECQVPQGETLCEGLHLVGEKLQGIISRVQSMEDL